MNLWLLITLFQEYNYFTQLFKYKWECIYSQQQFEYEYEYIQMLFSNVLKYEYECSIPGSNIYKTLKFLEPRKMLLLYKETRGQIIWRTLDHRTSL